LARFLERRFCEKKKSHQGGPFPPRDRDHFPPPSGGPAPAGRCRPVGVKQKKKKATPCHIAPFLGVFGGGVRIFFCFSPNRGGKKQRPAKFFVTWEQKKGSCPRHGHLARPPESPKCFQKRPRKKISTPKWVFLKKNPDSRAPSIRRRVKF